MIQSCPTRVAQGLRASVTKQGEPEFDPWEERTDSQELTPDLHTITEVCSPTHLNNSNKVKNIYLKQNKTQSVSHWALGSAPLWPGQAVILFPLILYCPRQNVSSQALHRALPSASPATDIAKLLPRIIVISLASFVDCLFKLSVKIKLL